MKKQNEEMLLLHQELFTFKQQCKSLRGDRNNGFRWRYERACGSTVTIRTGAFFDKSKLHILLFILNVQRIIISDMYEHLNKFYCIVLYTEQWVLCGIDCLTKDWLRCRVEMLILTAYV